MFDKQYRFKGRHALRVDQLTGVFDELSKAKLIDRNVDVYANAPLIGFLYGRTADLDDLKNPETGQVYNQNVMGDRVIYSGDELQYNFWLIMLLDANYEPDEEKRIDKAVRHYGQDPAASPHVSTVRDTRGRGRWSIIVCSDVFQMAYSIDFYLALIALIILSKASLTTERGLPTFRRMKPTPPLPNIAPEFMPTLASKAKKCSNSPCVLKPRAVQSRKTRKLASGMMGRILGHSFAKRSTTRSMLPCT